jgi:hypothetical protein
MSRAELRREERTNNKLAKWLMGLNREQKHLLTEYCIEQTKSDIIGYFNAYERVLRPSLYEIIHDEIETDEVLKKIIYDVGLEGINLHKFENGSVEYMKKIEDSRETIISKYTEMKKAGISEKDIHNGLKSIFPKLTASAIKNIIVEYKRDLRKEQISESNNTEKAVDYIFNDEIGNIELIEEVPIIETPTITIEESEKLEVVTETFKNSDMPKFEVLRKTVIVDVKGEYGTYHVENGIIEVNEERFLNQTEVKATALKKREELQKQIDYIDNYESEILEVMETYK